MTELALESDDVGEGEGLLRGEKQSMGGRGERRTHTRNARLMETGRGEG